MTLIVILNAVLAVLIVSAIVALQTAAILADRRHRGRPVARLAYERHSTRPIRHTSGYGLSAANRAAARHHEPVAA